MAKPLAFVSSALLCALIFSAQVQAEPNTRAFTNIHSVPLPAIALVDDSSALNLNPGAAGARDVFDLYMSKSLNPSSAGHFTATLGLPNLSLGFQQFQSGLLGDLRKFSTAYTYPLTDMLSFGAAYHMTQQISVADSSIHSFDLGMLIRPARFLSFGLSARNLNAPLVGNTQIQRAYVAGVGVRPLGERLTLTADVQWDEGDPAQNITALFGLETEPLDGLLMRGSVDLQGQFYVGAGFQFELFNGGYYHGFNGAQNTDGLHLQVTNTIFESALRQIGQHFAYINLSDGLVEDTGQPTPLVLGNAGPTTYWQLLRQLKLVHELDRYKGVVIDVGNLQLGLGMIEEVRQAIQELRATGKKVIVYLNQGGMSEYYLASAADEVVLHPLGGLRLNGFAYVLPYYREVLDKLGVKVEFIKVGQYKTGLENYTRESASEPTLEEYKSIQNSNFSRYAENLQKRRGIDGETFERIVNKALFTALEAKEASLVDHVAYRDELPELAANLIHQPEVRIEGIERLRVDNESWEPRDKIAVVYVSGGITEGSSGRDIIFGDRNAGSSTVVDHIYQAKEDPQVKALVLRINSPGGSPLASDEIYRGLIRYKELTGNPVIVSMGDVAASGGYWIALAGDEILANPGTITGSIGIYAGKLDLSGLYDKVGVNQSIIKTNPNADLNGEHRGFTEAERQVYQNNLRDFYRIFIERVSDNRKLDIKEVEQVAQGRVYTGEQALEINLVDQLGNLGDAIRLARKKAQIGSEEVDVVHLPNFSPLANDISGVQTLLKQGLVGSVEKAIQTRFPSAMTPLAILDPEFSRVYPGQP